jgi:hypothetical protein
MRWWTYISSRFWIKTVPDPSDRRDDGRHRTQHSDDGRSIESIFFSKDPTDVSVELASNAGQRPLLVVKKTPPRSTDAMLVLRQTRLMTLLQRLSVPHGRLLHLHVKNTSNAKTQRLSQRLTP